MNPLEEFKNRIDTNTYLKNYVDVETFLKACKKCESYGKNWSCPPYPFDATDYWKKYKYLYILGTKISFPQSIKNNKIKGEELKEYVSQTFLREKAILSERMQSLEKKYPGSVSLSAGSCRICENCARLEKRACLFPVEMRYSIESLGGNVEKTAKELLGINLKWTGGKLPDYLTLVNGFLTDDPDIEI